MSYKIKLLKAKVKWFFVKPRFIESYDMKKKILVGFLAVVNSFILWNLSLNMPEVELGIKWPDGKMTFEQPIRAAEKPAEVVTETEKPKEIKTCAEAVEVYGKQYGNTDLLKRIVDAESGKQDFKAANKESTARGCAQFVIGTWELYGKRLWGDDFYTKNVYNPKDNVELLSWAISQYGTGDWNASKHIWGK